MRAKEDLSSELDAYIGVRLRQQRLKHDLTLAQVAEWLDVSLQQVQKYELGQSRIPATSLYKLSQLLSIPPAYFYQDFEAYHKGAFPEPEGRLSKADFECFNVCLVEDDPADEMMMREIFDTSPVKTKIMRFHDGEVVLDFLKNLGAQPVFRRPDIILLDLNIPKRDGHNVLKEIKRDPHIKDIPVIILTNSVNSADLVKGYQNGASGYLCKSFDFAVFERKLHNLLTYWSDTVMLSRHCASAA